MSASPLDLKEVRADFPILRESIHGKRLAYLDNAATTQKPTSVMAEMDLYYVHSNANVHRAVHELAARATKSYEAARERIAQWINAPRDSIVFTRGTTESINLVARAYLQPILQPGDEVLVTTMEHHSNIVPWQLVGAKTVAAPINDAGELDIDAWRAMLNPRTKLVAVCHVSNALGTVNPIAEMISEAHARGIPVLIDDAQGIAHLRMDVAALDADFYAASAHKFYGPTGFGFLYAKREHLEAMTPLQGGGDMIDTVSFDGSTWNEVPYKFEAGTPDMAGAIGAATALEYLDSIGLDAIATHEHALLEYATPKMQAIKGLKLIGTAANKSGILSFVMDGAHPHDIGSILDQAGVAIRTGHHCTMPLMQRLCVPATARASLGLYNGTDDIDQLIDGLNMVNRLLG
ncbi:aminotransferase class V-fold PLP-dependent enzyme [Sinimarinibacterium sp. NLF-5-8]|uniref:aminotransferase class V-fold PLP-dependent enzyme n=1 Tax=Sinimarinibacterium sp. NLF-5-8 TaxID=2698684 RepID=UPI00137C1886|nr:SufS family cysteine desulfurase [Sinimarinibacterium sp. NLF-5-8]QHS11353.1 SufS family cysteine desulfurase [Sinimarinibacterium sp. NLF-5-8]